MKPVVLVVLDGWGLGQKREDNAIAKANLPTIDKLNSFYPHVALQASGISVGLPWGEAGNSEVGHITLGTGKVIYQNMPRITMAIQNGEFFKNESFLRAIDHARKNNSAVHLMGLVGKGAIHSTVDHLYSLLELMRDQKFDRVFVHVFTDGRDSSPTSGAESVEELEKRMLNYGVGKIATVAGRYFAMDRNNNWDRVKKSYDAMVKGEGAKITSAADYIKDSYSKEVYDEYMEPAVVMENNQPIGKIQDNDSIIFFNFREDRARQMTKAFTIPGFSKFEREERKNIHFVTMVHYEDGLPVDIAFGVVTIKNSLGEILSQNKLTQLRIAETEKFAHVTYFFNGGSEEPFSGEDRIIVPSKSTSTFDKVPEMSAEEITEKAVELMGKKDYAFVLINYANADIVGHTGNEKATIAAVETVSKCLEKLIQAVLLKKGCLLITSDHGNAEEMKNPRTGEVDTEHSTNPVPFWFVTPDNHKEKPMKEDETPVSGLLSDVAPTVLDILKIEKPSEMTGESLLPDLE